MSDFDVTGALPGPGVTVLEASAGTGKTYTIAALAARFVAEGLPLRELLAVTFTRAATGELRDRVRRRLTETERALRRPLDELTDEVDRHLATGTPEEVEMRRVRLAQALADFDAATITTTHGFCAEVLDGLGVLGDLEPHCDVVEDVEDLRAQVVGDLYLRRFREQPPMFDVAEATTIAKAAIFHPAAPVLPPDTGNGESVPETRARLAEAVRKELARRKRQARLMTYDDQLGLLQEALTGPNAAVVAERLRRRFRVVLVDEFQDTDPVQWEVLERAFGGGATVLVLIGDPKQAIYAFRGADVFAYLQAAGPDATRCTLSTNRRSDQALIDAHDALLRDTELGHPRIGYLGVRATEDHQGPGLVGAPVDRALRFRVLDRGSPRVVPTRTGYAEVGSAREFAADDCARDIARLLASGARLREGRPVAPGDVAVLVRKTINAELVQRELGRLGIPAVLAGAGSVFSTAAATDWLRLLEALERPSVATRARAAALTAFLGWDAERVALAGEDAWEALHGDLHRWARVLREDGVAALLETLTAEHALAVRLLGRAGGERLLTDLRHIGQLLHAAARREQLGPPALTSWLRRRVGEGDLGDLERTRRLESDDAAVQLLTVHRSKGLEWPVVYVPDLWDVVRHRDEGPAVFHDASGKRVLDVALAGPDWKAHHRQANAEERGEDLRLLYVALTRARHQCVVSWIGAFAARSAPLTRLLCRSADGAVPLEAPPLADDEVRARLEAVAAKAPHAVSVEPAFAEDAKAVPRAEAAPGALEVRTFDRELDRAWRRASYSSLTAAAREAAVASEPEERLLDDEPDAPEEETPRAEGLLDAMPGGRHVGTAVHRILERVDFADPAVDDVLAAEVAASWTDLGETASTAAGLAAVLRVPLWDGVRLADVGRADRLDELEFELPLAGGDVPAGEVSLAAIGAVLERHVAAGDPFAGYAERLADPALRSAFRGFLTGSIDLVVRLPGGRFAIADYKTNRLAAYDAEALRAEMHHTHYALQALLYTVALHRFLRWKLGSTYDPDRHLGGVRYLFLRGMAAGSEGVFSWQPTTRLVEALGEVLDGR